MFTRIDFSSLQSLTSCLCSCLFQVLLNGSLPLSVIEELVEEHLARATSKAKEGGGASQADSQQQQSVAFGEGLKLGLGLVALSAALIFAVMRPRASAAR